MSRCWFGVQTPLAAHAERFAIDCVDQHHLDAAGNQRNKSVSRPDPLIAPSPVPFGSMSPELVEVVASRVEYMHHHNRVPLYAEYAGKGSLNEETAIAKIRKDGIA